MTKTEQRALTQPFGLYVQGIMVAWLFATGTVSDTAVQGVAFATPLMLLASALGLRVFDGLSTARFQRIVVGAALVGAVFLLVRQL